jgi:magnesium-transporting ATPase (P-type)
MDCHDTPQALEQEESANNVEHEANVELADIGETRVEIFTPSDVIVSYQVNVNGHETMQESCVQKHLEEEMVQVVDENDDLQVVKKRDVDYLDRMERKPRKNGNAERRGSVSTTLTEYGSSITTTFTNTISGGYNIVRRNTLDKLPEELRSVKKLKKSTNAIVRKTLQIQLEDDSDEESEVEEEIEEKPVVVEKPKKQRRTVLVYANNMAKTKAKRRRWPNNYIRTTKYRWWSFIPQNLFEQFRRIHNIYFLITLIIQCIPAVSPVFPTSSILPFCIIIALTALKDLYEDLLRYRADRQANNKPCYVLRDGDLQRISCKDLRVGDIVRVDRDDTLCADIVCLSTSREDGACYIDTAQLDGETSLKTRRSVKTTHHMGNDPLHYKALKAKCVVEAPNANLDRFNGRLTSRTKDDTEKQVSSLDMNNLLLRVWNILCINM